MRLARQSKVAAAPRWPCRCYGDASDQIRLHPREVVFCPDCDTHRAEWVAMAEQAEAEEHAAQAGLRIFDSMRGEPHGQEN